MDSIRSLYEKVKPYWRIPVVIMLIFIVVSNFVGGSKGHDYEGTVERLVESQRETNRHLGDIVSGLSTLETGLAGLGDTVSDLQRLQLELTETTNRIELRSFAIGDSSLESGIVADRLYRVNRELAKRLEEDETE